MPSSRARFTVYPIRVEPALREVLGDQPVPRMDEKSVDALRLERLQVAIDLLLGHLTVPHQKGHGGIGGWWFGEIRTDPTEGVFGLVGGLHTLDGRWRGERRSGQEE